MRRLLAAALATLLAVPAIPAFAQSPELIFRRSTVFRLLSPNDKLATYGIDDPDVEGVACHFTVPEKGGWAGAFGFAEQLSEVSLACRQIGPIRITNRSSKATWCSARAAPSSSSGCRSSAAATRGATCWST